MRNISVPKFIPELVARFVIGFVFIESGWGKLHSLTKVIAYFESLHIPFASLQAPLVSGVELIGGLFILLGLFTRISSLPLIAIMAVAIRTAKWEDITDVSTLLGTIEFLYIAILTWLATYGSQYLSVDVVMNKFCRCKNKKIKEA